MHPYPHLYTASAAAGPSGSVAVTSPGLPEIATAPPPEFDGPGDVWSPEVLLCASLADCFILTFRALAKASKFEWAGLECRVDGVLEKAEGVTRFTQYTTYATLKVAPGERHRQGAHAVGARRALLPGVQLGEWNAVAGRGGRARGVKWPPACAVSEHSLR